VLGQHDREQTPFFVFFTLVLAALYAYTLWTSPELRAPGNLVLFTAAMLVHGGLHWLGPRLEPKSRWAIAYLAVQGMLAFGLSLPSGLIGVSVLYVGLIGEVLGLLRDWRPIAVAIAVYLGLAVLSYFLIAGQDSFLIPVLLFVLSTLFAVMYVWLYGRQFHARQQSQALLAELETAHRQLAKYATQVEDLTLAAERQRMARELHDTLAQGLAGLILQLEAADAHLEGERPQRAQEIVQQAMARARETLHDARLAIADLRAEQEASRDLAASVRDEARRFSEATGLPCALDLDVPGDLPDAISEHARRIVAEGLANVARHARASHAWVRVTGLADDDEERLEIAIQDDGIGFDPAQAVEQAEHYGLVGIRERARLLDGTFAVDSAPGQGTTLHLTLPL